MATRLIFPDYIVNNLIPLKACRRCGRSDRTFKLLFPQLHWHGAEIELIYPLRCPCGGSGCVPIRLPTLLFGYILASVALVDAANSRRSKATMTVSPALQGDILANIFRNFDRLMETCSATTPRSPTLPVGEQSAIEDDDADEENAIGDNDDDADRIKFGFDKNEWNEFLRRLGLDSPGTENGES